MKDKSPVPAEPFVLHRAYEGQISRSNGVLCPSFRTNLMLLVYVYLFHSEKCVHKSEKLDTIELLSCRL
jgi:hypothetical protein